MNKELIEKLKNKDYVRAFGLMKPKEQECYEKVGTKNCVWLNTTGFWGDPNYSVFSKNITYAIKPDYQPEPEYEILDIVERNGWLGVWKDGDIYFPEKYHFLHLHCIPSMPNFDHFESDDCKRHHLTNIAGLLSEGIVVYAVFRK